MNSGFLRLTTMRQLLKKITEFLIKARDVSYVSVPLWKPWRDF